MPTLAVTKHSCPPTKIGSRITSRMRSATRSASRSSATSGSRATNSSPPSRPTASSVRCEREPTASSALSITWSEWRTQERRRRATSISSSSPARVAERVVDDLEAVEVDQQQRHLVAEAARVLERALGAPDQLAPVRQAGQRVEVGQVADLVFGQAPVGHVLHDAGVADQVAVLVELGLGLDVDDALAAVEQRHRDVGGQHRAVLQHLVQQRAAGRARPRRAPCAAGCAAVRLLVRAEAEHAQALRARTARPAVRPLRQSKLPMRARSCARASLDLLRSSSMPRARGTQQVAQAPGQQAPLGGLDEEVGRAGLVGAGDRRVVVQAGQHQHRQRLEAGQARAARGRSRSRRARASARRARRCRAASRPAAASACSPLVGLGDVEAALAQRHRGQQQVDLVVVDQQHLRRCAGRSSSRGWACVIGSA